MKFGYTLEKTAAPVFHLPATVIFFSLLPALLAVLGNTSSYAQALFNIWYGLLPPIALLLLAYLFYRREANWLTFLGRAWFGIGTWFLLQTVLESSTKASPLLALLSLPAKFAGGLVVRHPVGYVTFFSGWGLVAGITVFFLGGLALYILGNRFKNTPLARFEFKRSQRTTSTVSAIVLVVFLVLSPLSIYIISKPTMGNFAQGVSLPTEEETFGYIKDVYTFGPRRPGSATYHEAATHLTGWFKRLTPTTTVERIKFDYWEEKEWKLVLDPNGDKPTEIECFFWPYSGQTPAEGITSELVYVGYGTEEEFKVADVKGKVALISLSPVYVGWN